MLGQCVVYEGRNVPKDGFRAFIYSINGKKLVNSWDEYLEHMSSGIWVSNIDDLNKLTSEEPVIEEPIHKSRRKKGAK